MISPRRAVLLSFLERYLSLVIYFGATVILARLLTPEELGIFSVGMAVIGMAHALRDFGVSTYVIQEEHLDEARVQTAFTVTLIISWSIGGILASLSGTLASFYDEPRIRGLILLLSTTFLFLPWSSVRITTVSSKSLLCSRPSCRTFS